MESITSTNDDSLLIRIHDAEDGSELTITLPDDIITPFNDGTFFVLVNGEESDDAEQNGNRVTIPFDAEYYRDRDCRHTCCSRIWHYSHDCSCSSNCFNNCSICKIKIKHYAKNLILYILFPFLFFSKRNIE